MTEPVRIPPERLSPEALESLVDDLVLSEGTDYSHQDIDVESKRKSVRRALSSGEAVIYFDPDTQSCSIRREPT